MKTASKQLKSKNDIPVNAEAGNTSVSQPGPEDGRDQNITPNSASYDPDNGKSKQAKDHNVEVHRTDEDDSMKSARL
ncbi:hypothetical protein [Flavobacterium wongokense]|uniref:hypothetical protein n=1 Tax=Flavobacterium wongokense TaxID=2910674 RepID=UPI001F45E676|nr:hypothetical protein [Flavobacterium sp. WG47]MCF6130882.1 hypothetical protein [Flavobacterium sp. WG47]